MHTVCGGSHENFRGGVELEMAGAALSLWKVEEVVIGRWVLWVTRSTTPTGPRWAGPPQRLQGRVYGSPFRGCRGGKKRTERETQSRRRLFSFVFPYCSWMFVGISLRLLMRGCCYFRHFFRKTDLNKRGKGFCASAVVS
jgi:hypothetical protein